MRARLSLAFAPVSGDLAEAVFGINDTNCVAPDDSPSWSTFKALYR